MSKSIYDVELEKAIAKFNKEKKDISGYMSHNQQCLFAVAFNAGWNSACGACVEQIRKA
jgi:bacterioferritin-associated ferredoxin